MNKPTSLLAGVMVPMVTPLDDNDQLNEEGLRIYTEWLIEQRVQALYPCSGCGEFWKLTESERKTVAEIVIQTAAGRVPVLPGSGGGSTREAIFWTQHALDSGADGVVIWPPYFAGPAYSDDAVFDHFHTITQAVDIPIVLYNSPGATGYSLSPMLVARLADIDNIVGLKDSSGDIYRIVRVLSMVDDGFLVYQGWDGLLLPSLAVGALGSVNCTSNVCGRIVVDLIQDFTNGDRANAQRKHMQLLSFVSTPAWQTDELQGIKECLNLLGIPAGKIRRPWFTTPFTAEQKGQLAAALKALGLLD